MDKTLLSRRLRKAAIVVSFLPLAVLLVHELWQPVSIFGSVWGFFALSFAFVALWHHRVGSSLIILCGALFFFNSWSTHYHAEIYLLISGVYTVGGILHFINAFFLEKPARPGPREEKSTATKLIYIAGFVVFGLGLGFWSAWQYRHGDTPLLINLPVDMFVEWLLPRTTPVFVAASTLFWGIAGTLFSLFLKPKLIAWIMSAYLLIFGGMTAWYYWG